MAGKTTPKAAPKAHPKAPKAASKARPKAHPKAPKAASKARPKARPKAPKAASTKSRSSTSANPWIAHVQRYRASHSCTYKDALRLAAASYRGLESLMNQLSDAFKKVTTNQP